MKTIWEMEGENIGNSLEQRADCKWMGSGCAACKMKGESCGNLEDLLTNDENILEHNGEV